MITTTLQRIVQIATFIVFLLCVGGFVWSLSQPSFVLKISLLGVSTLFGTMSFFDIRNFLNERI